MAAFDLRVSGGVAALTCAVGNLAPARVLQAGCCAVNHVVAKADTRVNREVAETSGLPYSSVKSETQHDKTSRAKYDALRARGHNHARALRTVADRLLAVACAMLEARSIFDPERSRKAA